MLRIRITFGILATAIGVFCFAVGLNADSPRSSPTKKPQDSKRVSLAVAKDRAKLMHGIYSATLDSVHRHYFRREGAVLPARALEDVFAEVDRQSEIRSRWIAVNTPAMSINHEPEAEFEKKAATEIAAGKAEFEFVEKGYYHRVGAIPLGTGCVGCHTKFSVVTDKNPRFAGLVISIPLKDEE